MKHFTYLLAISLLFLSACTTAKQEAIQNLKTNHSHTPATDWRHALIAGNGEMGILVHGDPYNERIILNHEFLYEFLGTEDVKPANIAGVMPRVKELIKQEKYSEAYDLTLEEAFKNGHPDILWTDPYHPACVLLIKQDFEGEVADYQRTTTYTTGELLVNWKAKEAEYTRSSFVSRPKNVIATKITASTKAAVNISVDMQHQLDMEELATKSWNAGFQKNIETLFPDKTDELNTPLIEPFEKETKENSQTFRVKYQLFDRGYEVIAQVKNKGGSLTTEDHKIIVNDADAVEIFAQVIPIEPYANSQIEIIKKKFSALASYDELQKEHAKVHSERFNRVVLNLDKTGFMDGSNEELIFAQKESEVINPYLLEKMFNMGLYGLISSSGKNPPNLMGIWNGEWRPRWSGDFTTDANVNLQIAAANIGNQPEALDSYTQMLERVAPDWEVNARNLHGCRGYVSGTRTSGRRNFHTHFGNWPGHYWTAGAGWLLQPCFEYYQCTGDEDFLVNRLLPMMKKTALFYEDFLDTYDENGKFLFAPSYSPENRPEHPNAKNGGAANATMDIAIVRELLTNLVAVHEELNLKEEKMALWKETLEKLPPYLVNEDGALKEWAHPNLGDRYNHRHVSHLYPVWPGLELNPEDTPEMFEAAVVAAQKRGRGNGSAHGLAHMALIGTRLKQSELVYGNLLFLMKNNYLYRSLFTMHNPGIIYNSDALHSIPATIMEMFVYSRPGVIEFLPALSDQLAKGSISGILCRTQAKVDELKWDFTNKTLDASVTSGKDQTIRFQLRKNITSAEVNGKKVTTQEGSFEIAFKKAETKQIKLVAEF